MDSQSEEIESDLEELLLATIYYSSKYELNESGSCTFSDDDEEEDGLKDQDLIPNPSLSSDSNEEISKYDSFSNSKQQQPKELELDISELSEPDLPINDSIQYTIPEHKITIPSFTVDQKEEEKKEPILPVKSLLLSESEGDEEQDNRYFGTTQPQGPICFVCGTYGHVYKVCEEYLAKQSCYLCGSSSHTKMTCNQEMCFNCERPGHISKNCPSPKRRRFMGGMSDGMNCTVCNQSGHSSSSCPLIWRRYRYEKRLTESLFNDSIRKVKKYCYWCSGKGHFGDDCPKRPKLNSYQHWSIFHQTTLDYLQLTVEKQPSANVQQTHSHSSSTRKEHRMNRTKSSQTIQHLTGMNKGSEIKPKLDQKQNEKSSNSYSSPPPPPPPPINAIKKASLANSVSFRTKPNLPSSSTTTLPVNPMTPSN